MTQHHLKCPLQKCKGREPIHLASSQPYQHISKPTWGACGICTIPAAAVTSRCRLHMQVPRVECTVPGTQGTQHMQQWCGGVRLRPPAAGLCPAKLCVASRWGVRAPPPPGTFQKRVYASWCTLHPTPSGMLCQHTLQHTWCCLHIHLHRELCCCCAHDGRPRSTWGQAANGWLYLRRCQHLHSAV